MATRTARHFAQQAYELAKYRGKYKSRFTDRNGNQVDAIVTYDQFDKFVTVTLIEGMKLVTYTIDIPKAW